MATAVVAVASTVAAGTVSSAVVGAGFTLLGSATLAGVVTGAVVGGVVSAAGAAIMGEDVGEAFFSGAITGGIAGGVTGYFKSASMAKTAAGSNVGSEAGGIQNVGGGEKLLTQTNPTPTSTGTEIPSMQGGGGSAAKSAGATPSWSRSPVGATGDAALGGEVSNVSNAAVKSQAIAGQETAVASQEGGLLSKVASSWNGAGDFTKGSMIQGAMQMGGGLLQGYGGQKAAEEEAEEREESRARANNFFKEYNAMDYALTSYGSRYLGEKNA